MLPINYGKAFDSPNKFMKVGLGILFGGIVGLSAAVQTSANYTVQSEVMDGGGMRVVSANYVNDGSAGGIGDLLAATNGQVIVRTGYIGQLYEVAAFTLAAPATNLNEFSTLPVSATQFLDDGTETPASSFAQWSYIGPIAGISPSGVVTAGSVEADTPATITARLEGWSAGLNILVIETGISPPIPCYNEIIVQPLPDGNMRLSFLGDNGQSYALERCFSLAPANWVPQMTNAANAGGLLVFTNNPVSGTNNFWRIRLVP
jgi:hypothetical protein